MDRRFDVSFGWRSGIANSNVAVGARSDKSSGSDLASIKTLDAAGRAIDGSVTQTLNDKGETALRAPGDGVRRNPQRQRRDRLAAIRPIQRDAGIDTGQNCGQVASVPRECQLTIRIHIVRHRMKLAG